MAAEGAYPMNPVVGFDRDPMSHSPSAGEYRFADGSTLYGDDPELYSQVGTDPNMSGGGQGMTETEQGLQSYTQPAPPPAPAPAPPPGSPFAAEDPVHAGVQAYAEGMPEAQQYDAQRKAQAEQQQREEFQRTHKYVPGRAGVTGEQLQAQSESGVEIPVATTTQVSPGLQDTPEDAEARADQSINERLAAQKRSDFERAKLGNQIAHLDQDTQRAQQEVGYRKILQESAAIQADKQMSVIDQTAKAYKEHKIDPKRIYGGSTFAEIGAILAQAGGAYAAILGGGQNYAQQIIDNAIERDVAVQRLEHEQLGEAADNAYTRFLRMTGDAKEAEDMLRATQNRLVGVERERYAAESGREEVAVALGEWETQHAAKRLAEETAIRERAIGKIVQSTQSQVAYPRAGSGGGYVAKTEKEIRKDAVDESNDLTTLATNKEKRVAADTAVTEAQGGGKFKVDPLYVEGYGQAATPAEATKIRQAQADGEAYESGLNRMEEILKKAPGDITPQDIEDFNTAQQSVQMGIAKQGGGVVQESEWNRAGEMTPGKISGWNAGASGWGKKLFDWGVTGDSKDRQLARIQALRKKQADITRGLVNSAVQGQHPEVPEPGATK